MRSPTLNSHMITYFRSSKNSTTVRKSFVLFLVKMTSLNIYLSCFSSNVVGQVLINNRFISLNWSTQLCNPKTDLVAWGTSKLSKAFLSVLLFCRMICKYPKIILYLPVRSHNINLTVHYHIYTRFLYRDLSLPNYIVLFCKMCTALTLSESEMILNKTISVLYIHCFVFVRRYSQDSFSYWSTGLLTNV